MKSKRRIGFRTFLADVVAAVLLTLLGALAASAPAHAQGTSTPDVGEKNAEDQPTDRLSAEERAQLKRELKAELIRELEADRQKRAEAKRLADEERRLVAEARAGEAERLAEEQARDKAAAAPKSAPNCWAPPDQKATLGDHPLKPERSRYRPGTGLHFESEDKAFALAARLRAQFRYQFDFGPGDPSHVFQIRRARLQFKGHVFGEHNKYKVEFAFSPRDLGVKDGVVTQTPLLTWYIELDHLRDLTLRAGQYKIPYSRQRVVSSGDLQLVDRSLANGEFNHDRDIGFDLRSKDLGGLGGYLRYYLGVYMGEGRDFGDRNATPDFKMHYLARFEVLPFGKFKDYQEADMRRQVSPKLSLGGAYSFHHQAQKLRGVLGSTAADGGTTDYHSFNFDYAFKFAGFSSTAEFHYRQGGRNAGDPTVPVEAARNGVGWSVQAGYLIPRVPFEVAARYSGIAGIGQADPGDLTDADGFTSLGDAHSVGWGLGYYFAGHPLKLQADYFRSWDAEAFSDGNNAIRVQLQAAL